MTAVPQTNVMKFTPPRSPRLPAPSKVTRICGNLTTSHWLKVRTLTEGCGRVQVAGAGGLAEVAVGSFATQWGGPRYAPFPPVSDHGAGIAGCLKRASSGHCLRGLAARF